ncbi:hypothetical protein ONS96_003918 [Cadophora gregata f. sp. sojae]|nr:hypothetical protein ONS96_003918 [Cadophora gregata f. sp. sojae]
MEKRAEMIRDLVLSSQPPRTADSHTKQPRSPPTASDDHSPSKKKRKIEQTTNTPNVTASMARVPAYVMTYHQSLHLLSSQRAALDMYSQLIMDLLETAIDYRDQKEELSERCREIAWKQYDAQERSEQSMKKKVRGLEEELKTEKLMSTAFMFVAVVALVLMLWSYNSSSMVVRCG